MRWRGAASNHTKATSAPGWRAQGPLPQVKHRDPRPAGDPIAPVEAMMHALWKGQTARHGARTAAMPETSDAARTGVHLTAALVQWFVSGATVRTP